MRWIVLASLLLVGCSMPPKYYEMMENQQEGEAIVWYEAFGRTDDPPKVEWVMNEQLNCGPTGAAIPMGWKVVFDARQPPVCVAGLTLWNRVAVAWWVDAKYSDTALPHEFGHYALQADKLDVDYQHTGSMFAAAGPVQYAFRLLAERGH